MNKTFALKGDICFSKALTELEFYENSYLISENGKAAGIYRELPEKYAGIEVFDYTDKLICPGMSDIHLHAPQYAYRGLGMDLELLDWLDTITFPQESRYADIEYAKKAYDVFV
ncbi:MAG: guanine deaminase, partial [Lachnospiraceae bacterium]|nr:guanine deaminase [Lachnospiraceae bacterium]